jgi:hypothetical protein
MAVFAVKGKGKRFVIVAKPASISYDRALPTI